MRKLIRDKTREFLQTNNVRLRFTHADESERRQLLNTKLLEEVTEYLAASGNEAKKKELADILHELQSLATLDNIAWDDVLVQAEGKYAARGGYDQLHILSVECDADYEDSPAFRYRPKPEMTTKAIEPTTITKPVERASDYDWRMVGDGPWYSG